MTEEADKRDVFKAAFGANHALMRREYIAATGNEPDREQLLRFAHDSATAGRSAVIGWEELVSHTARIDG